MKPTLATIFEIGRVISEMRRLGVRFEKGKPRPVNGVMCGYQTKSFEEMEAYFWSKVDKDGPQPDPLKYPGMGKCWAWKGSVQGSGYGSCMFNKYMYQAHRVVIAFVKGDFLEGLQACHGCDNPLCVNPDHIFSGTNYDNHMDCVLKGRGNLRLLTTSDVEYIRGSTKSCNELSVELGVCAESIRWAASGTTYKEVDAPVRTFVTKKLDPEKVRMIRSSNRTNRDLARELGVTPTLVGYVKSGKGWKKV